jgi:hypothetical protein
VWRKTDNYQSRSVGFQDKSQTTTQGRSPPWEMETELPWRGGRGSCRGSQFNQKKRVPETSLFIFPLQLCNIPLFCFSVFRLEDRRTGSTLKGVASPPSSPPLLPTSPPLLFILRPFILPPIILLLASIKSFLNKCSSPEHCSLWFISANMLQYLFNFF